MWRRRYCSYVRMLPFVHFGYNNEIKKNNNTKKWTASEKWGDEAQRKKNNNTQRSINLLHANELDGGDETSHRNQIKSTYMYMRRKSHNKTLPQASIFFFVRSIIYEQLQANSQKQEENSGVTLCKIEIKNIKLKVKSAFNII